MQNTSKVFSNARVFVWEPYCEICQVLDAFASSITDSCLCSLERFES